MADYTKLNIIRDCWWLMPSGDGSYSNNYIVDHNNKLSNRGNSLANSLNDYSDSTYVSSLSDRHNSVIPSGDNYGYEDSDNTNNCTIPYFGRLNGSVLVPDRIKVYFSGNVSLVNHLGNTIHTGVYLKFGVNNSVLFDQAWPSGATTFLIEKNLNSFEKERFYRSRAADTLDLISYDWHVKSLNFNGVAANRLIAKVYTLEVSYSGESTWNNYTTGLPTETTYHYPTGISLYKNYDSHATWASYSGNQINHLDISHINKPSTGVNTDLTYIIASGSTYRCDNRLLHSHSDTSYYNRSIYQDFHGETAKIGFNFNIDSIDGKAQSVERATLRLRMSHPSSGTKNENDAFSVFGWNRNFVQGNDKQELYSFSQQGNSNRFLYSKDMNPTDLNGYVLYGNGTTVGQSGFQTYNVDLNFVDGTTYIQNSGYISSTKYKDLDIFRNLELRILGLPSGVKLSSAELLLERLNSSSLGLYSLGDSPATNDIYYTVTQQNSGVPYSFNGNGRDRIIEPFIDGNIFNLGFTRFENLQYGDIQNDTAITSTSGTSIGLLKTQAGFPGHLYNTYRHPLPLYDYADNLYHRNCFLNALYIPSSGNTLIPINSDEPRIACSSIIDNLSSWTCYMSVGCTGEFTTGSRMLMYYGNSSDYKWYIYQDNSFIPTKRLWLNYKDSNNNYNAEYLDAEDFGISQHPDNILVSYIGTTSSGTFYFYQGSHTEVSDISYNYDGTLIYLGKVGPILFSNVTSELDLLGTTNYIERKELISSSTSLKNTLVSSIGFSNIAVTGYKNFMSWELIDSQQFESFNHSRSRLINLNDAGSSGIQFKFSNGSGYVDDYLHLYYKAPERTVQWNGPLVTNNKTTTVDASSVYIEYEAYINTNHPSGVEVDVTVDNYRFGQSREAYQAKRAILFNTILQSGTHNGILLYQKQYGFEEKPLSYSVSDELSTARVTITPKLHSLGNTNYYADVQVKRLRVYFDNIAVSATGSNDIDLYTQGAYQANSSVDLYIAGYTSGNNGVDLYIANGISYSGSTPLYAVGGYETQNATLFINGLSSGNNSTTLYIGCGTPSSGNSTLFIDGVYRQNNGVTLYTYGPIARSGYNNTNLFSWGTTNSGTRDVAPLMIEAKDSILPDRVISLFIDGGLLPASSNIPLYLESHYDSQYDSLNLYTIGPNSSNSGVPLIVGGYGITSGSIPFNNQITLFMARDTESEAHRMNLYIKAPEVTNSSVSLIINGAYVENSSVSLYNSGDPIDSNNSLTMYTHGY